MFFVLMPGARNDQEKKWTENYSRTASIWEETNVIDLLNSIYNDTVSVSKNLKQLLLNLKSIGKSAY